MLGYAVETRPARRKASPATLALIVVGHAALMLAVINSRMAAPERIPEPPIIVDTIKLPKDPAAVPPEPRTPQSLPRTPNQIPLDPEVVIPIPIPPGPIELGGSPFPGEAGPGPIPAPDPPKPVIRHGPKAATPEHALRPPYPEAKRRLEQEAVLRLRLAIDERGRVRSVDPLGDADPMFLGSARSHLIRHWRYRPATEGGRAVASSIDIILRFKLDEV